MWKFNLFQTIFNEGVNYSYALNYSKRFYLDRGAQKKNVLKYVEYFKEIDIWWDYGRLDTAKLQLRKFKQFYIVLIKGFKYIFKFYFFNI